MIGIILISSWEGFFWAKNGENVNRSSGGTVTQFLFVSSMSGLNL